MIIRRDFPPFYFSFVKINVNLNVIEVLFMKRKLVFVTLAVPFLSAPLLLGCQGSVDETPDGYIDVLPTETKDGTILQAFCWTYNDVK